MGSANIWVLTFLISGALDLSEGKMHLSLNIITSYVTLNQSFHFLSVFPSLMEIFLALLHMIIWKLEWMWKCFRKHNA